MQKSGSATESGKKESITVAFWERAHYVQHYMAEPFVGDLEFPRVDRLGVGFGLVTGNTHFNVVFDVIS